MEENICPYCKQIIPGNKKVFANHVRWCKFNPRYEEIKKRTIEKLKGEKVERKEHICICPVCGKEYTIRVTDTYWNKGEYKKTCCKECANRLSALKTNTSEKNMKISNTFTKKYGEERNKENGILERMLDENNRIVYLKKCEYCGKLYKTHKKTSKYCSKNCSAKYSHKKYIETADIFSLYKKQCRFQFSISKYPSEFDFSLIEKFGWYKAKNRGNNLDGVSRDHKYSIKQAFDDKIDPYIISHPANCVIIEQSKNASKSSKCSISLDELKENIRLWNEKHGVYENKIDYEGLNSFLK